MSFDNHEIIAFKTADLIKTFSELKGKSDPDADTHWWKDHVLLEWNNIRSGKNNTKWVSIKYRPTIHDKYSNLNICIVNELHTGQILPTRAEDVAELQASLKNKNVVINTRQYKASLQFQKWSIQVATQEDKVSLIVENGNPVLPDDKFKSEYFQVVEYIEEIIKTEIQDRVDRYNGIIVYLAQNKSAKDTLETVEAIRKTIGHVYDGDTIIKEGDFKSIKDKFPNNFNELVKGFIRVSSSERSSIIQDYISNKAEKNKGMKLPNPITRVTIPFNPQGDPHNLMILDKDKAYKKNGHTGFKNATIDDKPVNVDTIHKLIVSKCKISGYICMDSLCFSQIGISLPIKATKTIIVQQPVKREFDVFKICSDIYGDSLKEVEVKEEPKEDLKELKEDDEYDNNVSDGSNVIDSDDIVNDLMN